jgi:putative ABC transport system substrate-binding protein
VVADLKALAPSLSLELSFLAVRTVEYLQGAFADIGTSHSQALYVVEDPIFFANRVSFLQLASKARLPMIHELRRWPVEGSVLSYGPDLYDLFRRAAHYVDKIFKGARPDDLPVEQPTKFELVINLKAARGLGITPSPSLLARADQIIE